MKTESNRLEYKRELTASLEREVVSFLNYRYGGVIYLGIEDETGEVGGVENADQVQLQVKDRIENNISPSAMGLFDAAVEKRYGKAAIRITVASGSEKPYYLTKMGMSSKGCFIRMGSSSEAMSRKMIEELFAARVRNSIGAIKSQEQMLTFKQLKVYYSKISMKLNDRFARNLDLITDDGFYNYAGYLLSDNNGCSIQVAKYAGTTRMHLIENEEYGYCSLVKTTKSVLEKLRAENRAFAPITDKNRKERKLIDPAALREAVINAILHNDYSNEISPKFELFDDKLEITSEGGAPPGLSGEEFFMGYSAPRNKELMRVYRDLGMAERLGSGIPRILKNYDRSIYHFTRNSIRVVFPFTKDGFQEEDSRAYKYTMRANEARSEYLSAQAPPQASEQATLQESEEAPEQTDKEKRPQVGGQASLPADEQVAPQDDEKNSIRVSSQVEKTVQQAGEEGTPQVDEQTSIQTEAQIAPQASEQISPQGDEKSSPQADGQVARQADEEESPQVGEQASLPTDGQVDLQDDGKNNTQASEQVSLQVYEKDTPQVSERGDPQADEKNAPQGSDQTSPQEGKSVVHQVNEEASPQVSLRTQISPQAKKVLQYCIKPRSRIEIQTFLGLKDRKYFRKAILKPIIESGMLRLTIPDKPTSPKQKYVAFESSYSDANRRAVEPGVRP